MASRLPALLSYIAGRVVDRMAETRPARNLARLRGQRAVQQREQVERSVHGLLESVWTANVLAAAAETTLIEDLGQARPLTFLAARAGLPTPITEAVLDLLVALGFARRSGDSFEAAPGLRPFANSEGAAALRATFRAGLLQSRDFLDRAKAGDLDLGGWRHADPELIEAQGALSAAIAEAEMEKLALLPGLVPRLESSNAALLDVGAGAAALSIAFCRRFPRLRAVGLEPAPASLAIARQKIAEAGLTARIELRRQKIEDLRDRAAFDLAVVPQMFLSDAVVEPALRRVHGALRPGGWALVATMSAPGADRASALARLQNLLWGGNVRSGTELRVLLARVGFAPLIVPRSGPGVRTICARRPPAPR